MVKRKQMTAGRLIDFLKKYPRGTLVSASVSHYNKDEPNPAAREFIDHDERFEVVAVDYAKFEGITIGYKW